MEVSLKFKVGDLLVVKIDPTIEWRVVATGTDVYRLTNGYQKEYFERSVVEHKCRKLTKLELALK
jgi:hypothetical protein